jgi:DNA-binding CsgD family transcriptional regulator
MTFRWTSAPEEGWLDGVDELLDALPAEQRSALELRVVDDLPVAGPAQRHARLRTTHASLISEILTLLAGRTPPPRAEDAEPLQEPLSETELRVLRYLPTNLRGHEIASELFVSQNTIKAHLPNVYAKLGVHSWSDAVTRARELGLLSLPSSQALTQYAASGAPARLRAPVRFAVHAGRGRNTRIG